MTASLASRPPNPDPGLRVAPGARSWAVTGPELAGPLQEQPRHRRPHRRRPPATTVESPIQEPAASADTDEPDATAFRAASHAVILGAGVDVPFSLPTVPMLIPQLAAFIRGDGSVVDKLLRKKLPWVRLNFEKVGGDAGDQLIARLFDHPADAVPALRSIAAKTVSLSTGPVATILETLATMAESNRVEPKLVARLAEAAGQPGYTGGAEAVLDPDRIVLTPIVRSAIRRAFEQVVVHTGNLTAPERGLVEDIVLATSNIENLLSFHFARFSEGNAFADRRTYLYLAWMLWAFLRARSQSCAWPKPNFYEAIRAVRPPVVTFNYTDFMGEPLADRVCFFHGRLDRYLRMDSRDVVNDERLHGARDAKGIANFLDGLRLDVTKGTALDLPALVPPLTFKPILSREQLLTWVATDHLLQHASRVVIVGYSFAQVDEHFNDLLRKGNRDAQIIVINPDIAAICVRICGILGLDPSTLIQSVDERGRDVVQAGRLTCIRAHGEDITAADLERLLQP